MCDYERSLTTVVYSISWYLKKQTNKQRFRVFCIYFLSVGSTNQLHLLLANLICSASQFCFFPPTDGRVLPAAWKTETDGKAEWWLTKFGRQKSKTHTGAVVCFQLVHRLMCNRGHLRRKLCRRKIL